MAKALANKRVTLQDFIADALTAIAGGVATANQASDHNFKISRPTGHDTNLIEFDLAVTSSEKAGAKAGIFVLSIGAQAEASVKNEMVSRIKFHVKYLGPKISTVKVT